MARSHGDLARRGARDGTARPGDHRVRVVLQLGTALPAMVLETLRAQVPPQSLLPVALEGRLFAPDEALALGLLHELVAPEHLEQRAAERALELATLPPRAFAAIKRAIRAPVVQRLRELVTEDAGAWADTWSSEEGRERRRQAIERLTHKK